MKNDFMVCTAKGTRCIIHKDRTDLPVKDVEYVGSLKDIKEAFLPDKTLGSIKKELYTNGRMVL